MSFVPCLGGVHPVAGGIVSEGAVFFIFLLYAPVGATEWKREAQDQAIQQANNQAQELRIEQLEAELVELRALIKTKETS